MIDKLKQIEDKILLSLLSQPDIWNSMFIDYKKPIVERLWTQINKFRISLHFIHQCDKEDAYFHKHPWPSAMHVLEGSYEMGLGFGNREEEPINICTVFVPFGNMYYDMTNIDSWHYVRSINTVCSTVMLNGEPWVKNELKNKQNFKNLTLSRKEVMLEYFSNYFRKYYQMIRQKENINIQKGDWVEFDLDLMSDYDKKNFLSILQKKGFVIKSTETMIDARFGNDRFQINSYFLRRLTNNNNILNSKDEILNKDIESDDDDFDPDFL